MRQEGITVDAKERYRLTKMTKGGEIFEILEGEPGKKPKVIFRKPGLAPDDSYFKEGMDVSSK